MTLERLPASHPLYASVLAGDEAHLAPLRPPPAEEHCRASSRDLVGARLRPDSPSRILSGSELGAQLARAFGAATRKGHGKYRRNEHFLFGFRGEVVLAITEKGDRGSQWYWLPRSARHGNGRVYAAEAPEVAGFWPDMVVEVMAALGRPVLDLDEVFSADSLPCRRARAQALSVELDRLPLPSPSPRSPRM